MQIRNNDIKIIGKIIEKYNLADKDKNGHYNIKIFSNVRNENIDDEIMDIFLKNDFKNIEEVDEAINNFIYESYIEVEADMIMDICEEIAKHWDEFADDEIDFEDLKDIVWDNIYVNYDDVYKDIYDIKMNCFVALTNTNGEMNYDFSDSNLWEIRRNDSGSGEDGEFSYEDFEKLHNSNKFLCLSQGENMKMLYDYIFNYGDEKTARKNKYSAFIKSLGDEYMNATYGGCVVFLCGMSVDNYIKIKYGDEKNKDIIISKDAVGGIYDWMYGSGGPLELELNKDIKLKPGMFELYIDGEIGYDIAQTYGLVDSMWKNNVVKFVGRDGKVLESYNKVVEDAEYMNLPTRAEVADGVKAVIDGMCYGNNNDYKYDLLSAIADLDDTNPEKQELLDNIVEDFMIDNGMTWEEIDEIMADIQLESELYAMKLLQLINNDDKIVLESLVEKYGKNGVKAAINKLNEAWDATTFAPDMKYDSYVLVDEWDGAIIANYCVWDGFTWQEILNDAIEDARKEVKRNKYGSYGVYGCVKNEYDESTRVFVVNGINEMKTHKVNEWNIWDKPKDDDFYYDVLRNADRNKLRLIDVVDKLDKRNNDTNKNYGEDVEYKNHVDRLKAKLEKTKDPQEAEYLERRIKRLENLALKNKK